MNKNMVLENTEVLRALRYIDILDIINTHKEAEINDIVTLLYADIYKDEKAEKYYVKVEAQFDTVALDEDGAEYLLHDAIYSDSYEMNRNYNEIKIKALLDVEAQFIKEINEGKTIWIDLINDEINHINYIDKMLKDMNDIPDSDIEYLNQVNEIPGFRPY